MSNVTPFPIQPAAAQRVEDAYLTAWTDYYTSCRSTMDRQNSVRLADAHVAYLKKRDEQVAAAMQEPA